MRYSLGDVLQIEGGLYHVTGIIQYRNLNDNCDWYEYCLISKQTQEEKWLSIDDTYQEYSICQKARGSDTTGYHIVDSGTEQVIDAWGQVDVSAGERAFFKEYEDAAEEKIISVEIWDDEEETSVGYYLDANEIVLAGNSGNGQFANNLKSARGSRSGRKKKGLSWSIGIFIALWAVGILGTVIGQLGRNSSIRKHLEDSSNYTYTTSITGTNGEKADVYTSSLGLDGTVKDIIDGIEGDTESVQQNTEANDDSVAILTSSEYALVYISEQKQVLVQVSSRKFAYGNDTSPYQSRNRTVRFYRRFYYSRGYSYDTTSYGDESSPYSSFNDSTLNYNSADAYNSYSSSVRQSSVNARRSSGGGLSGGK